MADKSSSKTFTGPFSLGPDFPTPSLKEWEETAVASLKGRPVESLTKPIGDGVEVKVLYTALDGSPDSGIPGQHPFTRGSFEPDKGQHSWEACSLFANPSFELSAQQITDEVQRGAQSVWIRLSGTVRCGIDPRSNDAEQWNGDGIVVETVDDFLQLLEGIDFSTTPVHLEAGGNTVAAAASLIGSVRRRGIAPDLLSGSFNLDPLASLVDDGVLVLGLDRSIDLMAPLARWCLDNAPGIRALSVNTLPYNSAGATAVQEIAFALASGIDSLRALERAGVDPDDACRQIRFIFATGRDLFTDAAKLRAFRHIWAQAVASCGVQGSAAGAVIHTVSSTRNLTVRDPWVNPLRTTVGAFAAIVGGADAITILPFDALIGPADSQARRMAINTQTILREECHLDHVIDPGGGSWFIEQLTSDLIGSAWSLFQDIEGRGGMRRMVADDGLAEFLAPAAEKTQADVARRKAPVTGVSTWPNLAEKRVTRARTDSNLAEESNSSPSAAALALLERLSEESSASAIAVSAFDTAIEAAEAGATMLQITEALQSGSRPSRTVPLPRHRDAAPFEKLRDTSDALLQEDGVRPQIFLANLGPVSEHTARAAFAKNFFEAGGIATIDTGGFENANAAAQAFKASGAQDACICSSDARCADQAEPVARALKSAGARTVCLAGRPGDHESEWRDAGIDIFVFNGSDVLGILNSLMPSKGASS